MIDSVPKETSRPLWSVMIPTYNRNRYLEQTLESVLSQGLERGEIQIEVVDNCSTKNDPEEVVRKIGQGAVSFYRQPSHVSISANWNTCVRHALGHFVHILHDDDTVMPGFYHRLGEAFQKELTIGAAFCRYIFMDEEGHWQSLSSLERTTPGILTDWLKCIAVAQRIQAPAMVVRRRVYEELGGFCPELSYALDWEMWKRIVAHYPVWYEPRPLACFRVHSFSESARLLGLGRGEDVADTRRAIEISQSYLPKEVAGELSRKAREHYALYALNTARQMIALGDMAGAISQVREGLKCSRSLSVAWLTLRVFLRALAQGTGRGISQRQASLKKRLGRRNGG